MLGRTASALAALGCLLAVSAVQAVGNPEAGKAKSTLCAGCHTGEGMRINTPAIYRIPKIRGQHAEYLASALKAYRSGTRKNDTMHAMATSLSDQDIDDLAAYFASQAWR
jgi:cytochrome c553